MKASYEWKVGRVITKPEISAAWQHEFGDQAYSIVSSFANGTGNSFTVTSPQIGRDSLLIGAGAAVLLSERISIYAYYDGELLCTNYQSNNVSAGTAPAKLSAASCFAGRGQVHFVDQLLGLALNVHDVSPL
jgi:outer membrane autotransporter protein